MTKLLESHRLTPVDPLDEIEKLVLLASEQAAREGTTLQEKTDLLKVLAPYYGALKKAKSRADDEPPDDDSPTMGDLQRRLRVVEQEPDSGGRISPEGRRGN